MTNSIHQLATSDSTPIYYDEGLRAVLETHMEFFRSHPTTTLIDISPVDASKYRGDLYGLYQQVGIPPSLHWIVLRTNGYTSPNETDEIIKQILVPARSELDRVRQLYLIVHQIS